MYVLCYYCVNKIKTIALLDIIITIITMCYYFYRGGHEKSTEHGMKKIRVSNVHEWQSKQVYSTK